MYKDWKLALRGFSVCSILVVEALSNPVSQKKKQPIHLSSGQFSDTFVGNFFEEFGWPSVKMRTV